MLNENETIKITENGLAELKAEYEELVTVKRPENVQAIKEARALGDLSENAEYDAARNEQAVIEARITELEKIFERVEVIHEDEINTDVVSIGTSVKLEFVDDGESEVYSIVGTTEADPFENKISRYIKHPSEELTVGDVVTVTTDSTNYDVKVLEIMAQ